MKIELLKNYINKITKDDIRKYISKEYICASEEEIDIIYNAIKYDYEEILNTNVIDYITKHNLDINQELFKKIVEKYNYYKKFIE